MKILYCNKYNFAFSGTETYLFDVMDLVRSRGHEAALFSMADPRGASTTYDHHFEPAVDFKSVGLGMWGKARLAAHAVYSCTARRRLRSLIAEFRPDVAHVRNIYHHLSPSILWELKAQGVPVLYHLNDFKLLCPSYNLVSKGLPCERCQGGKFWHVLTEGCHAQPSGSALVLAAEAYFHKWLRTYEKCVDCFLAPSQFVKDKLIANGWNANKIEVLPHFQRLPTQSPAEPNSRTTILYFGRLSPEKGVADLLRAMCILPAVHLQIAGDGPQRQELEDMARRLHLTNVSFAGQVQGAELNRLIAASRFTVFPSRAYETLGKSILESYAWARPVVASDLGSRRELVQSGKTGLLFLPGDVEALAKAISFLIANPQNAKKMGESGRDLVRERYSAAAHYAALTQLYEQLAQPAPESSQQALTQSPNARLRVAFIGGRGVVSKYSGIETFYEEAGKQLTGLGHHVILYCRTYFTPAISQYEGMRLVRLPTIRSKHLDTLVHTFLSTLHVLTQDCDIVHYHALGPALFSFVPRLFGKKTVVTVQGLDWQRKKWGLLATIILRSGERASARMPNATMVVSRVLQQHYRLKHGLRTVYVPNGTSIRQHRPLAASEWDVEPQNYILFLGRFSPEKNCHVLIDAYERIETSVKLVMAGGSSHSDRYADELRRHRNSKIRVLDWVAGEDRERLLTNAMLFVLPSDIEGLSLALLDAMGAGVCVLASDIPENCELVSRGAGFTFCHGDVDDLERMLRLLICNPGMRNAAARVERDMVAKQYLWPQIAKQIDQTYQELFVPKKAPILPWLPSRPQSMPNRGKRSA